MLDQTTADLQPPTAALVGRSRSSRLVPRALRQPVRPRGMGPAMLLSLLPALLLFAIFYAVPLVMLLGTAFTDWSVSGLSWVGLENFSALLHDGAFWKAARNTLYYSAAGVFVQVPLGVLAGVLVARRLPGWQVFRAMLFLPTVISGAAFALTYSMFYNAQYGLLNNALGLVGLNRNHDWLFDTTTALPAVAVTFVIIVGFTMLLVMAEIAAIPGELYEAAQLDGATVLQRERYITLPALRNVVGTCVLLTLLGTLKLFDVVFVMTSGGPADSTATLGTYTYTAYTNNDWGYANAIGVLTIVLGFIVIVGTRHAFRLGEGDA
jgi:raffinose/stachyose/melibiose transport system permease protein